MLGGERKKKDDRKFELDMFQNTSLYKTELCRSFEDTGMCRYGKKCQFAHSKKELRVLARHPKVIILDKRSKPHSCCAFSTKPTCANRTIQLVSVHMGRDATLFMMPMTRQRIRRRNANQSSRRSHASH